MLRRGSSFGSSERDDFVNEKKRDDHRERGPTTAESVIEWLNKDSSSDPPIRKIINQKNNWEFLLGKFPTKNLLFFS